MSLLDAILNGNSIPALDNPSLIRFHDDFFRD